MTITDPTNLNVIIPVACMHTSEEKSLQNFDYQRVIETPSCVIEVGENRRYYFRSIGKHTTILLEVTKQEGGWMISDCQTDPHVDTISCLLENGKFIPGILLAD